MKLKRILATVLTVAMVLSMMSFSVFADECETLVVGTEAGEYATVDEALEAAADGDTIILSAGEYTPFSVKKSVTIKGEVENGEKLTVIKSLEDKLTQCALSADTVTFEDIKFTAMNKPRMIYNAILTTNSGTNNLNVINCDFYCTAEDGAEKPNAIYASSGSRQVNLVVEGCTFDGFSKAVYCYSLGNDSDVQISKSVMENCSWAVHVGETDKTGICTIDECDIDTTYVSFVTGSDAVIKNSDVSANIQVYGNVLLESNNLNGSAVYVSKNGSVTLSQNSGDYVVDNSTAYNGEDSVTVAVAEKDGVYYDSLSEAMTANGSTVNLLTDIDLNNVEWEPVSLKGNFNGNGHTISNLKINKPDTNNVGFITSVNGTFENVNFVNVDVVGKENVAAIAGRAGGSGALVKNVTVTGDIKVEATVTGYARAGVIVGGWAYGRYIDITVDGGNADTSYIKHTGGGDGRYVAGIVGHADDVDEYTNCTVKNISIKGGWLCGGIAGPGPADTTTSGCVVENVKIGADYSGGLFGWFYATGAGEGVIKDCVVRNVEFTDGAANNGAIGGYGMDTNVVVENITIENVVNYNGAPLISYLTAIGNKYYATLDDAIAAAQDGDVITLVADAELNTKLNNATINIDLNGYKMDVNVGSNYIIGENSISNGTVDISNASSSQNIFGLAQYKTPATTLTMDNVNFIGDGFNSGYAVFEIGNSGADVALTITDSTIDLKNDNATQGGFVKGSGPNCVLTITNTEVTLDNTDMFNVNVAANITDSEFTISNLSDTAFRNLGGTIDNSVISVTNSSNGIRNSTAGYNLAVKNNSSIKISGSTNTEEGKVGDLVLAAGNKVDVDATSELLVETSTIANADDVTGNVISKADSIYVQFREVDAEEGTDKYEIVLVGANEEKINELASADLTFDFKGDPSTNAAMSYFVKAANGVSLTQIGDRFMFNYNGVDKYEESGLAIVIGTITVEGYGSYTLKTDAEAKNAVYATEIRNNIVDGFVPAAGLVINEEIEEDGEPNDGMVGIVGTEKEPVVIAVPTRELTINIDFPNEVIDQSKAYQNMKVEITGNIDGVNKTVTYDLGGNMVNGSYVVKESKLVLNNAYTVTVSGAGYRTARYTVTMTKDKTINFWNNVMDNETVVEEDKHSEKKNFLAGDIVKDNNINIYDLSAVVSYFGTQTVENGNILEAKYAKYDLNRDGVIDSKDVAYVLVSWGE